MSIFVLDSCLIWTWTAAGDDFVLDLVSTGCGADLVLASGTRARLGDWVVPVGKLVRLGSIIEMIWMLGMGEGDRERSPLDGVGL